MEHPNPAIFAISAPGRSTTPLFDPEHPDAEILEAFSAYTRLKIWAYAQEDLYGENWPKGSVEEADDQQAAHEAMIFGNFPTTPAGAAAQLITLLPMVEQAHRWFDRGIVEQGILPFYTDRKKLGLEGTTQQLLASIRVLLEMEWDQTLAAYEHAAENVKLIDEMLELVDGPAAEIAQQLRDRQRRGEQLSRLLKTLTPCKEAYQRKAAIVIAERAGTMAVPWMLRDFEFLLGRIDSTQD